MKQGFRRCISLALSLVITLGAVTFPASAAGEVTSVGNIWSHIFSENYNSDNPLRMVVGGVVGLFSDDACLLSDDGKHRGYIKRKKVSNEPTDKTWIATCSSCSTEFEVMEDQFKQNYDSYTNELNSKYGATNIGKDGTSRYYIKGWKNEYWVDGVGDVTTNTEYPYVQGKGINGSEGYRLSFFSKSNFINLNTGNYKITIPAPVMDKGIESFYSDHGNLINLYEKPSKFKFQKMILRSEEQNFLDNGFSFTFGFMSGIEYYILMEFGMLVPDGRNIYSYYFPTPYIEGVKLFSSDSTEVSTNQTRPGSMSGNFGQLVNGNVTQLENSNNIINETTNTYYNPITNTSSSITDWNYDYSDRSYNVTTNEGDRITVTYGDENVTIKEGDTIYNIYYMYPEPKPDPDPDPDPEPDPDPPGECTHTYTEEITTPPSCLMGGIKTFTCTKCQKSYTEKLPASGHSWAVDRTVNTTYDENGAVLTEGYTIYKCTGCGNEYKDTEGKGPPAEEEKPDPGGGNIFTWLFDLISGFFGWIVKLFTMAAESIQLIISKVSGLLTSIPAMFSGFTAFLSQGFGFIPSEIIVIITLGVVTMVVVGVLKLLLK